MVSNIANRNVSLILAVASFAGLIYCICSALKGDERLIELCSIVTSTGVFTKMYLRYRKAVKQGNLYGRVNLFR